MSHTFWAGIVVWLTCLLVALLFYGRARLEQPVLAHAEPGPVPSTTLIAAADR